MTTKAMTASETKKLLKRLGYDIDDTLRAIGSNLAERSEIVNGLPSVRKEWVAFVAAKEFATLAGRLDPDFER